MTDDIPAARLHFVLGGARSGKTRRALAACEALWDRHGLAPVYVATAEAGDDEMAARIAAHRAERGPHWTTVEAPRDPAAAVARESAADRVLMLDCLTLWLSNLMLAGDGAGGDAGAADLDAAGAKLVEALRAAAGPVVVVANEAGLGVVPDNALARRFRDAAGALNQRVAAAADRVEFMAAGLPLTLKGTPES